MLDQNRKVKVAMQISAFSSTAYRPTPASAQTLASSDAAPVASRDSQSAAATAAGGTLSEEAQAVVDKLKARDREVRTHEQAHIAAAGGLSVSGPSYTYQRGPDGGRYAIGGHVNIDVSPGRTPEETVAKARAIERAALAPAQPSGQDRVVAASARQMAVQASAEQRQARQEENKVAGAYASAADAPALPGALINTQA